MVVVQTPDEQNTELQELERNIQEIKELLNE